MTRLNVFEIEVPEGGDRPVGFRVSDLQLGPLLGAPRTGLRQDAVRRLSPLFDQERGAGRFRSP